VAAIIYLTPDASLIPGDQQASIAGVMALLREAGGLLRIEDVLPLFPDFVTIDAFKVLGCMVAQCPVVIMIT
jgi:hypothetical protein